MTTPAAPSTDIVSAAEGFELVEAQFNKRRRAQVAAYFGVSVELDAFVPFLAWCARHALDPIGGLAWLLKGKDGRYKIYAGRDGYLTIANRQEDFLGVVSDVHRAHDQFGVQWTTNEGGMVPVVSHSYAQGTIVEGDKERTARGAVLGAWAMAFRRGRNPVYFYAPFDEYARDPNKTAWGFKSGMITTKAESNTLRRVYGIAGAVPLDEVKDAPGWVNAAPASEALGEGDTADVGDAIATLEIPENDQEYDLRTRIMAAVGRSNERVPGSWTGAKVQMVFGGQPAERMAEIVDKIEDEVSSMPDPVRPEDIPDGDIPDAEVVQDEAERLRHEIGDLEGLMDEADEDTRREIEAQIGAHEERLRELEGEINA